MSEPPSNRNIDIDGTVEDSQVVSGDRNLIGDGNTHINQDVNGDRNTVIGVAKNVNQSTHYHAVPQPIGKSAPFGVPILGEAHPWTKTMQGNLQTFLAEKERRGWIGPRILDYFPEDLLAEVRDFAEYLQHKRSQKTG